MKMYLIVISILLLLFFSFQNVSAEEESVDISLIIYDNNGLKQYSYNNYTFNCEQANGNSLTIEIDYSRGSGYLTVSKNVENHWIEAEFEQLEKLSDIYLFQFNGDGLYRLRITVQAVNGTFYKDFFVNVVGGDGTYVAGDIENYVEKGRWVDRMMLVYGQENFEEFASFAETAIQWYVNPFFILTDFLMRVVILLLFPEVLFLITIFVSIVILYNRKRIRRVWEQRLIEKKHGTSEDRIKKSRRLEEEKRLRQLEAYPTEEALLKYGSGDVRSRSVAYHQGLREYDNATFSTAYSLVHLGEMVFGKSADLSERGEQIIRGLTDQYKNTLEESWIYKDISACCRALSSESVDVKTKLIVKDKWMQIAALSSERASEKIAEATSSIELKYEKKSFAEIIDKQKEKRSANGKTDEKTSNSK